MIDITETPMENWADADYRKIESLMQLKKNTSARIGIGHTGFRYKTDAQLRFWADQAAASDAVFTEVSAEFLNRMHLPVIQTKCRNKLDMIKRPDWGRIIGEDEQKKLLNTCTMNPQIQIYFGDGLSSPAVTANAPDMLPVLIQGLTHEGLTTGTPFFIRYCRVNTARTIGPLLGAEVVCVLLGERPGMMTDESMSAYIAYKPHQNMQESEYTVVSNISRKGIPPVEAAAHIVDLIVEIHTNKKSGISI